MFQSDQTELRSRYNSWCLIVVFSPLLCWILFVVCKKKSWLLFCLFVFIRLHTSHDCEMSWRTDHVFVLPLQFFKGRALPPFHHGMTWCDTVVVDLLCFALLPMMQDNKIIKTSLCALDTVHIIQLQKVTTSNFPTECQKFTCGRTCEPFPSSASPLRTERPSSPAQCPSLKQDHLHSLTYSNMIIKQWWAFYTNCNDKNRCICLQHVTRLLCHLDDGHIWTVLDANQGLVP